LCQHYSHHPHLLDQHMAVIGHRSYHLVAVPTVGLTVQTHYEVCIQIYKVFGGSYMKIKLTGYFHKYILLNAETGKLKLQFK